MTDNGKILKFYQYPVLSGQKKEETLKKLNQICKDDVIHLDKEYCFNVVVGKLNDFNRIGYFLYLYNILTFFFKKKKHL